MNSRVALVVPYFGKLPIFFPLFLRSVEANPEFSLLLITNDVETCSRLALPENVNLIEMDFLGVQRRIRLLIGMNSHIKQPYKLCDYRPLYGLIFADELENFDFWGHCDLDMLWGDLSAYVTDELLRSFDRLFLHGHFSLYRNAPEVNELGLRYPDDPCALSMALATDLPCYFDEVGYPAMARRRGLRVYENSSFADITPVRYCMHLAPICTASDMPGQRFWWENGHVVRRLQDGSLADEFMYIHFQKRPMNVCVDSAHTACWEIRPDGFYSSKTDGEVPVSIVRGEIRQRLAFEMSRLKRFTPERVRLSAQIKKLRNNL